MADILSGKLVADAINERAKAGVKELKEKGVTPALAIVRAGERGDDIAYERSAAKRCGAAGVLVKSYALPEGISQGELLGVIDEVNKDDSIHGCLLLRPLPGHIDGNAARNALCPSKDVDGITDLSIAGIFTGGGTGFAPCTARAVIEILDYYGYKLAGRRAAVIGRSLVIGKPVAMMMMEKGRDATVTVCHTKTADMAAVCREAEILVAAAGRAGAVGRECFSPGQVVIDVGINFGEDGKMLGDADFEAAMEIAGAVTPVPGGVGIVTSSVLACNVVEAAGRTQGDGSLVRG